MAFLGLQWLGCSVDTSYIVGTVVVFVTRMAAVYFNWSLPSYRPLFETVDTDKH